MSFYFISNKKISTSLKHQSATRKWHALALVKDLSITRKLFAAYSFTFILIVGGITLGFEQGRRIEKEAIAIQAEANEDIEIITELQDDLLNFFFLKQKFTDAAIPQQEDFLGMQDAYMKLQAQWTIFLTSDELLEGADNDDELEGGVSEVEAVIAQELMEEHADDFESYLDLWQAPLTLSLESSSIVEK